MVRVRHPMGDPQSTAAGPGGVKAEAVELLILGAGWTSNFLIPLLVESGISHAATSTTGRPGTIKFRYEPGDPSPEPFRRLPAAGTVLITFPLRGEGPSRELTDRYAEAHAGAPPPQWIQLGSTGVFPGSGWNDEGSGVDPDDARARAEAELLAAVPRAVVLNLAGLWDAETRDPRGWVARVARSKDAVRTKGSLHLVHGADVARAVVAVHRRFTPGRRWIVADLHTYDWWDLILAWGATARARAAVGDDEPPLEYERWVAELMVEEGVRALPRGVERLGRVLDSRAFWKEMGIWPIMGRPN